MKHGEQRTIRYVLQGKELTLHVQPDHERVMFEILTLAEGKINQIRHAYPTEADLTIAHLACIVLAEEVHLARQAAQAQAEELTRLTDALNLLRQNMLDVQSGTLAIAEDQNDKPEPAKRRAVSRKARKV